MLNCEALLPRGSSLLGLKPLPRERLEKAIDKYLCTKVLTGWATGCGNDHIGLMAGVPQIADDWSGCPSRLHWALCHEHRSVHTAMRNCTGDEGRSFEFDNQVLISSHRKLLWSKAMVVNVAESRDMIPSGMVERGERKRTTVEVSKAA
jgi:hypothetical protein